MTVPPDRPQPSHEGRIARPGGDGGGAHWLDRHRLLVAAAIIGGDGPVGSSVSLATQISAHPATGSASLQAAALRPGSGPVLLAESEIDLPARGWEVRSSGLWADHVVEDPFRHWSYGLEAFALLVDRPDELLGAGLGERVPFGWELDFESGEDAVPAGPSSSTSGGYRQFGLVHGLLLVGSQRLEVEGPAIRSHRWGPSRPGTTPADGDAVGRTDPDGVALSLPTPDGVWVVTVGPTGEVAAVTAPAPA